MSTVFGDFFRKNSENFVVKFGNLCFARIFFCLLHFSRKKFFERPPSKPTLAGKEKSGAHMGGTPYGVYIYVNIGYAPYGVP